ncbi:hypothetical protein IFT90_00690 [Frigoribacterium sp. CFBP 8766]|uniref:hypothetical protein n=1 Tax=Frigoribacterium sp. CFBP 8766 TaxID=2775273 RepID=UPI00177CBA05|nr:hypothetical protein [Frigoribacterium sp. CFBP 8766]MBD8583066.1 hypothetical protein [Frigoribacterium sp. CFBP 8766]
MNQTKTVSVAHAVRTRVLRGGARSWTTSDFPDYSASAVTAALQRMARQGDLLAVHHGIYWRGTRRPWGMSRPDSLQLTRAIFHSKGVGWAGLSASNALGLNTQVPAVETIAVPVAKPRSVRGIHFVDRARRTPRAAARLTPLEVAFLEVLGDWTDVLEGSPKDAVNHMSSMLLDGEVDCARLVKASAGEDGPVRDRLRHVLHVAGKDEAAQRIKPSASKATTRRALAGIAA